MNFRKWMFIVPVVTLACSEAALPTGGDPLFDAVGVDTDPMANRYIVLLRDPPDGTGVAASSVAQAMGIAPSFVYGGAVSGFAASLNAGQVVALEARPDVMMVEPDGVVQATPTVSPVPSWGLDRIDMMMLPLDNSYTWQTSGAGVEFYGIDTGIRSTHSDFAGRMALPGFTSIFDGVGTEDCNGHGTHTASTAAGAVYGVARGMSVTPVRVLDCLGFGSFAGVIAGVDWVTANATLPAVANMSLSGGTNAAMNAAVAASTAAGVTYAVAAGNNNGLDACLRSPASEPSALTIAATDITDQRAGFSNRGTCVDLFAPGVNITAAWSNSDNGTNTISGTSMATPHVAGVAGLYLENNPGDSPAQVAGALVGNATPGVVGNPGSGSPNLMLYMGFIPPAGNQPPVASFTWSCDANLDCTFDGTGSTDDNGIVSYVWTDGGGAQLGTGSSLVLSFGSPTTFDMTLTVEDADGLTGSQTQNINVSLPNQAPVANFTVTCDVNLLCTFDGTSSTDDVGVVSYVWLGPGGGQRATGPIWINGFNRPVTLNFSLVVTDAGGLSDTLTQSVTIQPPTTNQPPVASFTWSCDANLDCIFDGTGSTDDNGIVSYTWTDGSGTQLGTGSSLALSFGSPTTFDMTLTVQDAGGLTGSQTQTVNVSLPNQAPVANFTYSCTVARVCTFDATSSTDDVGVVLFEWLGPGGGVVATGPIMVRQFGRAVTINFSVRVTDGGGLQDTQTQAIVVP